MALPRTRKAYVAFNAGEMSPKLDARIDIEKYGKGCRQMQNMIPMPHGGVTRRKGFEFIAQAKFSNRPCRLMDFQFSRDEALILEWGRFYVRFFYQGNPVMDGPDIYEISSPYDETEVFGIQYVQINDVIYITHPDHAPRKLSRFANDNWTLTAVSFTWPALLAENATSTTIDPSGTTGGITLTASSSIFTTASVGSRYQIAHRRSETSVTKNITATGTSANIDVLGGWRIVTSGTWTATLEVQRFVNGGWETIKSYVVADNRNIDQSGEEAEQVPMRINVTSYTSSTGTPTATLEVSDAFIYGLVRVTGYTSGTVVSATVEKALFSGDATTYWAESAWSPRRGYPAAVAFFQQRIYYGGSTFQPQTFWGSALDDFENFRRGTADDDSFAFTLSSEERNQIVWMLAQNTLAIGTTGGEWSARGSDLQETISPTNINVTKQSNYGSSNVRPLLVNGSILFVQRNNRKVREFSYDEASRIFQSSDVTVLSDHITAGGLKSVSYQSDRDSIYWGVTNTGNLVGMTYEKEQSVIAWHRHNTQGFFESVETIYGTIDDEVWVCVRRFVNGNVRRFIERMSGYFNPSVDRPLRIGTSCRSTTYTLPAITQQPQSAIIYEGGSYTFMVVAVGATGYQWYKNDVLIGGATSSTLTIIDAESSDEATYHVVVSTDEGPLTSDGAELTVIILDPAITEEYTIDDGGTPTEADFLSTGLSEEMTADGWVPRNLDVTVDGGSAIAVLWVHLNGSGDTPDVPTGYTAEYFVGLYDADISSFFDGWLIYETP